MRSILFGGNEKKKKKKTKMGRYGDYERSQTQFVVSRICTTRADHSRGMLHVPSVSIAIKKRDVGESREWNRCEHMSCPHSVFSSLSPFLFLSLLPSLSLLSPCSYLIHSDSLHYFRSCLQDQVVVCNR